MAMKVLPPGFRFHPTDVELLKYYLKKKILGRPYFESIQEVNIYELDPWDLPGLSCLQTGDQKWYFFCPRERKYVHGDRAKRSTPGGFWKTTGKDRPVMDNDGPVGMIKTLIFHTGRPPGGSRTDWVMHEYRLEDRDLAAKGIPQDTYVVCAIFEKGGLGPRNGAQYGAPFKEEDWEDDGISFCLPLDQLFAARGSAQALMPLQEEQQDHFARNQDEAYNNLSESIVALGSPPPALAASETVLPEPSMPVLSTPTTAINHVNEAIMEDAVNDTIADGMDFDEFLDMITSSPANNYYQETQTTSPATNNGAAALAPTAAEGDGFFADLPELDVGLDVNLGSGDGFGFNGNYYPRTDGFVELRDLGGQQLADVPTFPANLQGGIDTGNAGDQYPDDWGGWDAFLEGIGGRNS